MASELNIVMSPFTQTSEIQLGASDPIGQVYLGSNLIWQKTSVVETWYEASAGSNLMASYTPSSAMTVSSFSMVLTTNSTVYNYIVAIVAADGTNLFNQTGTSGVSIVAGDTLESQTKYTHTWAGTGPSLSASTTYYFCLGERYATYSSLASSASTNQAAESLSWSLTNDPVTPNPVSPITDVFLSLEVTGS